MKLEMMTANLGWRGAATFEASYRFTDDNGNTGIVTASQTVTEREVHKENCHVEPHTAEAIKQAFPSINELGPFTYKEFCAAPNGLPVESETRAKATVAVYDYDEYDYDEYDDEE